MIVPDSVIHHGRAAIASFASATATARAQSAPQRVDSGRMTRQQAIDGVRIAAALAELWQAAAERRMPTDPELLLCETGGMAGATFRELREEAAKLARTRAECAARQPDNDRLAKQTALAEALAWHHRPFSPADDTPCILVWLKIEQAARAKAGEDQRIAA